MYKSSGPDVPDEARHVNVSDARRELPSLLRDVAEGGAPYTIGPRGTPSAVLIGAAEYAALLRAAEAGASYGSPAGSSGWSALRMRAKGGAASLNAAMDDLRRERAGHLDRLTVPAGATKPAKRRRARG